MERIVFRKIHKTIAKAVLLAFVITSVQIPTYAQSVQDQMLRLPAPGVMVRLSPEFTPAHLQGMTIHPDNALQFDFLIHKGDQVLDEDQKKAEYKKLVKYFLASLTIPDEDQWVNLSPYEKDRIIKDDFGKTEMGRDLLAQDYMLKQITSSLIYPEDGLGKKFWDKVYERAWKEYHTTNVPVNTFNKVWIVPDQAYVYESGNTAYILKSHLKVMLEEDYFALSKHQLPTRGHVPRPQAGYVSPSTLPNELGLNAKAPQGNNLTHTIASQVIRAIILPELEKEVNEGKNFANLRQMYSGMILATWYKKTLKESLLGRIYADKTKVKGVDQDPKANEAIYQRYLKAFKKGVFNYIKEDVDKYTNEEIPRKYFSGGFEDFAQTITITPDTSRDYFKESGVELIVKDVKLLPPDIRLKLNPVAAKGLDDVGINLEPSNGTPDTGTRKNPLGSDEAMLNSPGNAMINTDFTHSFFRSRFLQLKPILTAAKGYYHNETAQAVLAIGVLLSGKGVEGFKELDPILSVARGYYRNETAQAVLAIGVLLSGKGVEGFKELDPILGIAKSYYLDDTAQAVFAIGVLLYGKRVKGFKELDLILSDASGYYLDEIAQAVLANGVLLSGKGVEGFKELDPIWRKAGSYYQDEIAQAVLAIGVLLSGKGVQGFRELELDMREFNGYARHVIEEAVLTIGSTLVISDAAGKPGHVIEKSVNPAPSPKPDEFYFQQLGFDDIKNKTPSRDELNLKFVARLRESSTEEERKNIRDAYDAVKGKLDKAMTNGDWDKNLNDLDNALRDGNFEFGIILYAKAKKLGLKDMMDKISRKFWERHFEKAWDLVFLIKKGDFKSIGSLEAIHEQAVLGLVGATKETEREISKIFWIGQAFISQTLVRFAALANEGEDIKLFDAVEKIYYRAEKGEVGATIEDAERTSRIFWDEQLESMQDLLKEGKNIDSLAVVYYKASNYKVGATDQVLDKLRSIIKESKKTTNSGKGRNPDAAMKINRTSPIYNNIRPGPQDLDQTHEKDVVVIEDDASIKDFGELKGYFLLKLGDFTKGFKTVTLKINGRPDITVNLGDVYKEDMEKLADTLAQRAINRRPTADQGSESANPAMAVPKNGGIDFNSANLNLQIKRDGRGVPLPWPEQDMAQLSRIQGFEPQIIEIKPAVNVPIISELQEKLQAA